MEFLKRISILFIIALFSPLSAAKETSLTDHTGEYPLGLNIEILEDASKNLSISDAISESNSGRFTESTKLVPSFGFSKSAYWIRAKIDNKSSHEELWLLECSYAPLQRLDTYVFPNGINPQDLDESKSIHLIGGSSLKVSERPFEHRTHIFPFYLKPNAKYDLYIRIESEGSKTIPLTLWRPDAFSKSASFNMYMIGAYFGVMAALFLYNLFIYITVKENSYAYYIFFLLCTAMFFFSLTAC